MRIWGLLLDLNLVTQEPINFTTECFETRTHHIFHFFFSVLEAAVHDSEALNDHWLLE